MKMKFKRLGAEPLQSVYRFQQQATKIPVLPFKPPSETQGIHISLWIKTLRAVCTAKIIGQITE